MFFVLRRLGPRRPGALASSQQMHMQMEYTLSSMLTIINDNPESITKLQILGDFGSCIEKPPQYLNVLFFGLKINWTCTWLRRSRLSFFFGMMSTWTGAAGLMSSKA